MGTLCAAELGVDNPIVAKVVLTGNRTSLRGLKVTVGARATVNVQERSILFTLPERCREMEAPVSSDVDVFHLFARITFKIKDVEVLEVSTEVVSEIDAVGRVAACYSPVG